MKRLMMLVLLSAVLVLAVPAMSQVPDTLRAYGVLNLSVANMRAEPDFSSEMISQGLLGMPVRVLQSKTWQYIRTPDRYEGWVHPVAVRLMTREELEAWNRAEKIVVTAHYGFVRSLPRADALPVSDVVAGDRLRYEGRMGHYYLVSYPDGRRGYIDRSLAQPEREWRRSLRWNADAVLHTAQTLTGVPYLWAGTSSKGVDCSGFVRTVLFMPDIIIPRDASQQARVGRRIDIAPDFSNLEPGDLVFFGRKATAEEKERVTHVAFYLGGKRFIHSQGDVHVSSFDPADPLFDEFNLNRLLFATRILPYICRKPLLETTETNELYIGVSD